MGFPAHIVKENGMIMGIKNGRSITYSLTPAGERAVKKSVGYFCRAFKDIFESA